MASMKGIKWFFSCEFLDNFFSISYFVHNTYIISPYGNTYMIYYIQNLLPNAPQSK